MKSRFRTILFPMLAAEFFITSVHAAVNLANGSFETTGTLYNPGLGGLREASGWTNLSPSTNYQASSALANVFDNGEFTSPPGTASGSRYLRLVADVGNVGVLAQSLGTMTAGETYTISADIFGGTGTGETYGASISLVNAASAAPAVTYASQTVSGVTDGVFTAGAFNFTYTATPSDNGNPLVLLLTTPALGAGQASRGGLDNIQLTTLQAPGGTQWSVNGDGSWNTPANWSPSIVPNAQAEVATLDSFGGTITGPVITTLDVPVTLGTLQFNHSFSYTVAGGNALTLDNAGSGAVLNVQSGAHTISAPVTMADFLIASVAGGSLDLAGTLSGSALSLLKNGPGILQLSGINTYTGATTVSAGTLKIATGGEINNAGPISAISGGTLQIEGTVTNTGHHYIGAGGSGSGTNIINSGGVLNVGGAGLWVSIGGKKADNTGSVGNGTLTLNGGNVNIAAGTLWFFNSYAAAAPSTINLNGGTLSTGDTLSDGVGSGSNINFNGGTYQFTAATTPFAGVINLNVKAGGAIFDTGNNSIETAYPLQHSGIGTDGGLTKLGTGVLTLSNTSTYDGKTTVTAGTLALVQPYLADTASVAISATATLDLQFVDIDTIDRLFINGVPQAAGTWGAEGNMAADHTSPRITGSGLLNVTTPPSAGYAGWASSFLPAFSNTAADLDFENDGLASGIEWVVGGNPTLTDAASVAPTFNNTSDPNNFLFTFRRRDTAAADPNTTIVVQYGSNLTGWTTAQNGVNGVLIDANTDLGGGFHQVTVAIPRALAPGGRLFARLNVIVTP